MADDRRRQLRLILPVGTNHSLHSLALREGRSDSGIAVRLIAEAIDSRRAASGVSSAEIRRLIGILTAREGATPAKPPDTTA
jgi:hypothetical protein